MIPSTYNLQIAYRNDTWIAPEFKLTNMISTSTSGELVESSEYAIVKYRAGDDFENVGAENLSGSIFTASATTPTIWTKKSTVALVERVNLTAATIRLQVYDGTDIIITLTNLSGILVTDATNGEFEIINYIPTTAGRFKYDLQVTFASGVVSTYLRGDWVVIADITQNS